MPVNAKVRSGTEIRMVKTRLDGTQVDLGVVSAHYSNPVRQAWWRLVGRRLADARIAKENKQTVHAYRQDVNTPDNREEPDRCQ